MSQNHGIFGWSCSRVATWTQQQQFVPEMANHLNHFRKYRDFPVLGKVAWICLEYTMIIAHYIVIENIQRWLNWRGGFMGHGNWMLIWAQRRLEMILHFSLLLGIRILGKEVGNFIMCWRLHQSTLGWCFTWGLMQLLDFLVDIIMKQEACQK